MKLKFRLLIVNIILYVINIHVIFFDEHLSFLLRIIVSCLRAKRNTIIQKNIILFVSLFASKRVTIIKERIIFVNHCI